MGREGIVGASVKFSKVGEAKREVRKWEKGLGRVLKVSQMNSPSKTGSENPFFALI